MINLKPTIMSALKGDAALVGLLGSVNRISFQYPQHENEFPQVTYFEIIHQEALRGDGRRMGEEIHYQVDVRNLGSTSEISDEVDRIMDGLGFILELAADIFQPNLNPPVYQKSIRYSIKR